MSTSAFDAHTDPLFKNLKLPNLESIYKLQIGKFMFQYRSGLLPYSFNKNEHLGDTPGAFLWH